MHGFLFFLSWESTCSHACIFHILHCTLFNNQAILILLFFHIKYVIAKRPLFLKTTSSLCGWIYSSKYYTVVLIETIFANIFAFVKCQVLFKVHYITYFFRHLFNEVDFTTYPFVQMEKLR